MTAISAFVGNDAAGVRAFEDWLGRELDFVRAHGGRESWADFNGSLGWLASQFESVDAPIYWSVPMIVKGATLAQAATGAYNAQYAQAARTLLAAGADQDKIHVRIGEEFNGDWMPWAAKGKEADFIATFRQIVQTFRGVSDKFVFEWNVNIGDMGMDPAKAYPGDDVVDFIGMDFYWNTLWDPKDPAAAWDYMVTRKYGLQWLEDFADARGKPTAYSEWGVSADNAGVYIAKAAAWFAAHDVAYQSYWDSNADFPGMLSSGQYPTTGQAFIDFFSKVDLPVAPLAEPAVSGAWQTWMGGTAGDDVLTGDARNNKVDGGAGADTMTGGAGDDAYTVDRPGDVVVERTGEGVDTVDSYALSYGLSANVENLNLVASYAQTGIGNALANRIAGGQGADTIIGLNGDDWLSGGGGQDTFAFAPGQGKDTIVDFAAGAAGDRVMLEGFQFASFAAVQAALQTVAGGVRLDLGGQDSIFFKGVVASAFTSANFAFSAPLAAPAVSGAWQTWMGGTAGADSLLGDARNNKIDGGAGVDTMAGGAGDDLYTVENSADQVVERAGQGVDTVHSYARYYTLSPNMENIELLASFAQTANGNALANRMVGGAGADLITGRAGDDWMAGGGGRDTFVFNAGDGRDVIADFETSGAAVDRIDLRSFGLSGFAAMANAMHDRASGVEIDLPAGGEIHLLDVQVAELTALHFLF
jgi:Ca2+-binding RTX toxin-like protein